VTTTTCSDLCGRKPRSRRAITRVVGLAAAIATALAAAGPALAADDLAPLPPLPAPPVAVPGTQTSQAAPDPLAMAVPAVPSPIEELSQEEPPITVEVTESQAGNIDVSVRVLSPDDDETSTAEGLEPNAVSSPTEIDITAEPASPPQEGDTAANTPRATGSNVNVLIRVLSPGDDGRVDQTSPSGLGNDAHATTEPLVGPLAQEREDAETEPAEAPSAATAAQEPAESAGQYHEVDSRYHSDSQSNDTTWHWMWHLALDCDGNALSSSTETGLQSSLDWDWEWAWEWSCGAPPRPPPLEQIGVLSNDDARSEPSGADDAPRSTETGLEDPAAGEPWLWSWSFTFCGETVSAALPISTQTELRWQWDWSWNWTCETQASQPAPTPDTPIPSLPAQGQQTSGGAGYGATEPDPGAAAPTPFGPGGMQIPAWLIPRMPFANLAPVLPMQLPSLAGMFESASIAVVVELETPAPPDLELVPGRTGTEPGTTIVVPPLVTSPLDAPGSPDGASARGNRGREPSSAANGYATQAASTRARHPGTVKPAKQRSIVGPRRRAPQSPLELPPLRAAGISGPLGGFVPGGSVAATAALVAFLLLTAPGLGRRVRVAPELRPRGTYGSSIDHPG
jgi:hypothetical protein